VGTAAARAVGLTVSWRQGAVTVESSPDDTLSWDAEADAGELLDRDQELVLKCEERRSVSLHLRVPRQMTRVKIDLGRGPLVVRDLVQPVIVNVGAGTSNLSHLTGPATANVGKGDFQGQDLRNGVEVNVGMGALRLTDCHGPLKANGGAGSSWITRSHFTEGQLSVGAGSAYLTEVGGRLVVQSGVGGLHVIQPADLDLDANSGLGSLEVEGGRLQRLKAELGRGSVRTRGTWIGQGALELKAGSAQLSLPPEQHGRVEALAERGRVVTGLERIQVPFPGGRRAGERVVLTLGPGPESVVVEARRGNITVERLSGPPVVRDESPRPPATTVDTAADPVVEDPRRIILERLQAGDLSPEEAARLIDALSQD
jgi:hypothetical protein